MLFHDIFIQHSPDSYLYSLMCKITVYPLVFIYTDPKIIENSVNMNSSGVVSLQLGSNPLAESSCIFGSGLTKISAGRLLKQRGISAGATWWTWPQMQFQSQIQKPQTAHSTRITATLRIALYLRIPIYPRVSYKHQYIKLTMTFHWKSHITPLSQSLNSDMIFVWRIL